MLHTSAGLFKIKKQIIRLLSLASSEQASVNHQLHGKYFYRDVVTKVKHYLVSKHSRGNHYPKHGSPWHGIIITINIQDEQKGKKSPNGVANWCKLGKGICQPNSLMMPGKKATIAIK